MQPMDIIQLYTYSYLLINRSLCLQFNAIQPSFYYFDAKTVYFKQNLNTAALNPANLRYAWDWMSACKVDRQTLAGSLRARTHARQLTDRLTAACYPAACVKHLLVVVSSENEWQCASSLGQILLNSLALDCRHSAESWKSNKQLANRNTLSVPAV